MIGFLRGRVVERDESSLLIDCGTLGYQVSCPSAILLRSSVNAELFIYHHITEQTQALFGFETWEQRNFFKLLLGLSGVGPKVAMKILESVSMAELSQMVADEDMARLAKLPGLGAKSAEKVFLELKRKLGNSSSSQRRLGSPTAKSGSPAGDSSRSLPQVPTWGWNDGRQAEEISSALQGLGYKDYEIKLALAEIKPQLSADTETEEALRLALSALS